MSGAERVLVVGAAGFGRESLDVLDAMVAAGEPVEIVGVLDDGPSEMNLARLADRGVTYLGTIDDWLTGGDLSVRFVLGIGSPSIRRTLVAKLAAAGLSVRRGAPVSHFRGAHAVGRRRGGVRRRGGFEQCPAWTTGAHQPERDHRPRCGAARFRVGEPICNDFR